MKSIKKNYFYNLCYQILLVITPLITTPYISRILNAGGVGTYSYAVATAQYFVTIAIWGSSLYGQREISYVQTDFVERSRVFWSIVAFRFVMVVFAYVCYLFFSHWIQNDGYLKYVVSLNIINVFFDITWFFQGLEEFGRIVLRNSIFKIIDIFLIFTLVKQEDDLLIYALIICGSTFIGSLSLWFYLPKFITIVSIKNIRILKRIPVITSLFIPTIAIQVYTVLDKFMIGFITRDFNQNGCYEQSERIAKMALTMVTALGSVMFPRIGMYYSRNESNNLQEKMYGSYRFVWFLSVPLCLGLAGISDNVIPWFLGSGYELAIPLLKIFSILVLAIGFSNVTGIQYLIPTKRQKLFTKAVSIGAIVNVVMNLFLIPQEGAVGAAIASVTAETIIAGLLIIWTRKEFAIERIIDMGKNYIIAGSIMYAILKFEGRWLSASFANSMIMIVTGMVIYFLILILLRDIFFMQNVMKVFLNMKDLILKSNRCD